MADEGRVTGQVWRWTVLASMASYIDAGSIVAGASGLALWQSALHMNSAIVGLLAAFSSNAISTAVGALIGGRLGDLWGRKRIYQFDLLVYAFGILWIVFAQSTWMLFVGYVLVGLAVGADVPTSWSLVGEFSPNRARAKLLGLTQVFWGLGPFVVLVLAFALSPLGVLGTRIVFAHLFVVALVTWALRQGMVESERWRQAEAAERAAGASKANPFSFGNLRLLGSGPVLKGIAFTAIFYTLWNTAAGTNGFFLPYLLKTVGTQTQAQAVAFQCLSFALNILAVTLLFMRFADGSHRRLLLVVGMCSQVLAFAPLIFFPLNTPLALANIVLFALGGALAGEPFYRVWSQELFPTMLRGTAQGVTFAIARFEIGIWSFFVPLLVSTTGGFHGMALILTLLLLISGLVAILFMPDTAGRSLEEIQQTRTEGSSRPGVVEIGS